MSNREAVRDGWFSLLRDALGSGDPFRAGSMLSSRAGQLDTGDLKKLTPEVCRHAATGSRSQL